MGTVDYQQPTEGPQAGSEEWYENSKDYYVGVWRACLQKFAGWPEPQVSSWVKARLEKFDGDYTWLVTEMPFYWIAEELIPIDLKEKIGVRETAKLIPHLLHAVENGKLAWNEDPNYDWDAARERIRSLVSEYHAATGPE
jgi:hypothetical protein